jgi:rod shape-determining protein MreB and related proteins
MPEDGEGRIMEIKAEIYERRAKENRCQRTANFRKLAEPFGSIVKGAKVALEHSAPELAADIVDKGIVLTGAACCSAISMCFAPRNRASGFDR